MIDVPAFLAGLHEQLFGKATRHPTLNTTLTESLLFAEVLVQLMETRRELSRYDLAALAHQPRGDAGASAAVVPVDVVGRSGDALPA